METKNQNWVEIQPTYWVPKEEGDKIEGILLEKKPEQGRHDSMVYVLKLEHETLVNVYGSTVLDSRMKFVNVGQKVRIEYRGTELTKREREVKIFKVYVLEQQTL